MENATSVIAVLTLYRYGAPCFCDHDLDLLDALSLKLSAAIENSLRYQAAAEAATTDPATGLANGRALFQRLDAELERARRSGTRLAGLAMFHPGVWRSEPFVLTRICTLYVQEYCQADSRNLS